MKIYYSILFSKKNIITTRLFTCCYITKYYRFFQIDIETETYSAFIDLKAEHKLQIVTTIWENKNFSPTDL